VIKAPIKLKNPRDSLKYVLGQVVPVPWPEARRDLPLLAKSKGKFVVTKIDHRAGEITVESVRR